ncbi:hypothetical protein Tco_1556143 [Tanacetum coccineum]
MRIVLTEEDKLTCLEHPIPVAFIPTHTLFGCPVVNSHLRYAWPGKTMNELHVMLKLHEQSLPKKDDTPVVLVIKAGRIQKNNKNKKPLNVAKGKNQADEEEEEASGTSTSGVLLTKTMYGMILYLVQCESLCRIPVFPPLTGCDILNLYVGNGHRAVVEAIGSFNLCLPNGLVIVLENFHYAPSITKV